MKERGKGKAVRWYTPWAAVLDASRVYLQGLGTADESVLREIASAARHGKEG